MSVDCRHRDTHPRRARGALRLALSAFVPIALAAWVVGCGDPRPPVAVGSIPELTLDVGSTESVDLAGYFSDPDGDGLNYRASSSNAEVATAAISGDAVEVTGVGSGTAEITVTASDGSESASQDFTVSVRLTERRVLEILYEELDGDDWIDNTNWNTDKPLGEWHRVSTDADGRVVTLVLWENSLSGEIPPELGNLSSLETLYLHGNSLSGEIPPELGKLSNLRRLVLYNNSLSGDIPSELGDLSNLEYLYLGVNSLSGDIPSELGDLSNLEYLSLSNNSLTGAVPSELGDLSNLELLYLHDNSLTGEIPARFLNLSSLEEFYWHDNGGLCAPDTNEFDSWLGGLWSWRGAICD